MTYAEILDFESDGPIPCRVNMLGGPLEDMILHLRLDADSTLDIGDVVAVVLDSPGIVVLAH